MFFSEMKRKYFNIVFLLVMAVGVGWLYSAIKPSATTTSYDVYKYSYYKPLSKEEFIYFNLKRDYENGTTIAYSDTEDKVFWPEFKVHLSDTMKQYFLDVIQRMNPDYSSTEKMHDVELDISLDEVRPYLKELEEKLGVPSFYYTGMFALETYNEKYDMVASPSPYWIYLRCDKHIFSEDEYYEARKDFELSFQQGISNGYARVALDYIGLLIGILSIAYSFQAYSEDKRANINGFIYTEKIESVQHVLDKYFATVIPLMMLSVFYMLFASGCFMYWNYKFKYGYTIDILAFLKPIPWILFPTICITAAISHLLGVLFQKEMITVVIQFVLFYLSISGVPKHTFSLNTIIRYNDFDDYSFYQTYLKNLPWNRFFMMALSILFLCFVIILFEYRKEHEKISLAELCMYAEFHKAKTSRSQRRREKLLNGNHVKKVLNQSLFPFTMRQSVHYSALFCIPYLCLMYPIVVSKNMDASDIATIGENILIFLSFFLFIRLGNIEKRNGMEEQIFTADTNYPLIYLTRVCIVSLVLFVSIEVPLGILCIQNSVPMGRWCLGVYLSSLFLGILSLFITELLENSFAGYLTYITYYFFDIVLQNGMILTVSGYTKRISQTKIYLAAAITLLLIALTICVYLKTIGIRMANKYGNKN